MGTRRELSWLSVAIPFYSGSDWDIDIVALVAIIVLIAITHVVSSHPSCVCGEIEGAQRVCLAIVLHRGYETGRENGRGGGRTHAEMALYDGVDVSGAVLVEFDVAVGSFLYINRMRGR